VFPARLGALGVAAGLLGAALEVGLKILAASWLGVEHLVQPVLSQVGRLEVSRVIDAEGS
jgi:hypothetical protein